jgi:hypothetical protein
MDVQFMLLTKTYYKVASCCILLLLLVGCGEKATTVNGSVTYNGEPVQKGTISFRPVDGTGQSFGARIKDGKYTAADKATPGQKLVVIFGTKEIDHYMSSEEAYRKAEEAKKAGKQWADGMEPADYIAEDAEGNGKQVEIMPGDQTIDFSITGVPRPE